MLFIVSNIWWEICAQCFAKHVMGEIIMFKEQS